MFGAWIQIVFKKRGATFLKNVAPRVFHIRHTTTTMGKQTREQSHTGSAPKTPKRVKPVANNDDTHTYYYCNNARRGDGRAERANFFLSPLFPVSFVCGGVQYRSVAHFMQAAKYDHDPLYQRVIMETVDPVDALHLGKHTLPRQRKNDSKVTTAIRRIVQNRQGDPDALYRRTAWHSVRADLFQTATLCKFAQNPALCRGLLQTYPSLIVEDSTDPDWGGSGSSGLNMAGQALVRVRTMLIQEQQPHGETGLSVKRQLFPPCP